MNAPVEVRGSRTLSAHELSENMKLFPVVGGAHIPDTLAVPLYDPVKLLPPPPLAPPITLLLKFSGVPAWSELW